MSRRFGKFSEKGTKKVAEKVTYQADRELISISLRDNRIGCFSESGQYNRSLFYNDLTLGCLEELEMVLDQIEDNDTLADNIKIIFVPGLIMALVTGLGDYIRLGKTSSGTVLSKEIVDAFVRCHEKISDKSFNLNIRTYDMCPVEFGQKAKDFIVEECKDANAEKDGIKREPRIVSSVNPAVEALNKKVLDLIAEGKFTEAQQVAQILATMSGGSSVVSSDNNEVIEESNDIETNQIEILNNVE